MRRLFYNGEIITMENGSVCEAMLIDGGKIAGTGNTGDLEYFAEGAEKIDLKGLTVLPAFIDPHSHILAMANTFLQMDLSGIKDENEIKKKIDECEDDFVRGWGLSNEVYLDEKFLDSFDCPVVIQHNSGHSGFFNKKAQEEIGSSAYFMQETEFFDTIKKIPMPNIKELADAFNKAEEIYMSKGISVAQEGVLLNEMLPIYEKLIESGEITLDIFAYKDIGLNKEINSEHFKTAGYKIFLDGSPQAKTAWVSMPYENTEEYGISTMSREAVNDAVKKAIRENKQIIAHCNGDKAIERFIDAIEENKEICKLRPVIIHGQLMRYDQIKRLKELNIIPSFFLAHIYHYGDIHIKNLGERAEHISPMKSALKAGVYPTMHQDSPIIEPDMFESIWCAVTRRTRDGVILGAEERVSVYEALETVTLNAARQYFEENERGSLAKGKAADFIITDKNPLSIDKDKIRDISVLCLYKNGEVIYQRKNVE